MSTRRRTWVGMAWTAGLLAIALAVPLSGQDPPGTEVPRVTFLEPPPAFGAEQQAELDRVRAQLAGMTRLYDPSIGKEREAELLQQAQPLLRRMDELREQQRRWADYQAAIAVQQPDLPQHRYLEGGIDDQVDVREVLGLYDRFRVLAIRDDPSAAGRELEGLTGASPPSVGWQEWERFAGEFDRFRGVRFKLRNTRLGGFHLRSFLIQGRCWLYAAVEHWRDGRRAQAFRAYEKGLRILQRVLVLAHEAKRVGGLQGIDELPADMDRFMGRKEGEPSYQHYRRAGIRGLEGTSTSAEARRVLGRFCPWGVEVYFFLRRIGYTAGLDLDILPPFYAASGIEQPPKLCVQTLAADALPRHVREDMAALVGGRDKVGTLREPGGRSTRIDWYALTKPSYSLWIVSPTVFDLKPSEILNVTAHIRKIFFGFAGDDPRLYGQRGYLMDVMFDQEVELAEWQAGGKKGIFYATSKVVVEGMNAGFDQDLVFDYAEKGFNWTKLVGFVAAKAFGWMEQQELEWLFDGLEPRNRQFGDFRTYGDSGVFGCGRIPPILLRAELYGVERTEPYEYRRKSRVVRYYVFDPGAISGLGDAYQLNDFMSAQVRPLAHADEYVAGNQDVVGRTWAPPPLVPPAAGQARLASVHRYVVDTAPKAQTVHLQFDPELHDVWRKEGGEQPLEVRFYDGRQRGRPVGEQQDFVRIPLTEPYVTAQFVNAQLFADGLAAGSQAATADWCFLAGVQSAMPLHLPDPDLMGPVLAPGAQRAPSMAGRCVLWELTRDYTVRVMAGEQVRAEFALVFMGSKGRGITGRQTWPFANVCLTVQRYPEVGNAPIAVEPVFTDLLPIGLVAYAKSLYGATTYARDGQPFVLKMPFRDSAAQLEAQLTGHRLDHDYYRATVALAGRNFTMWGKARGACGGADLQCELAVPPGRHEVVITVPRANNARYTLVIEREACPFGVSNDLQRAQQSHARALATYRQSRRPQDAESLANRCVELADQLENYGEYRRAYDLLLEAQKLAPGRDYGQDTKFCSTLYATAFHVGDAKATLWAGPRYVQNLWGRDLEAELRQYGRGHQRVVVRAGSISRIMAETLRRFVSLGGDPANATKLHWQIVDLWARAGCDESMLADERGYLDLEWGMEPGRPR